MNYISFPGINLELNISPVAFKVFGLEIYWYAVIIVFAMALGLLLCKIRDGKYGIKFETILDIIIYVIPVSIITARLYYILFNLSYYIKNPLDIFDLRSGGLAIYGGIIGGVITIWLIARKKKKEFLDVLDFFAPSLAIGQAIGRWGNFINVEAYGTNTSLPWRMGIYEWGKYIEVHPTFLYESICTLIIFIILINMEKKRKFTGQITGTYLMLYGIARGFVEMLRVDSLMLRKS